MIFAALICQNGGLVGSFTQVWQAE